MKTKTFIKKAKKEPMEYQQIQKDDPAMWSTKSMKRGEPKERKQIDPNRSKSSLFTFATS